MRLFRDIPNADRWSNKFEIRNPKRKTISKHKFPNVRNKDSAGQGFGHLNFGHWRLPFDVTQGGESFDVAQDPEVLEGLVEPFRISCFGFRIFDLPQIVVSWRYKTQPSTNS